MTMLIWSVSEKLFALRFSEMSFAQHEEHMETLRKMLDGNAEILDEELVSGETMGEHYAPEIQELYSGQLTKSAAKR
jgi:hypothetical protein